MLQELPLSSQNHRQGLDVPKYPILGVRFFFLSTWKRLTNYDKWRHKNITKTYPQKIKSRIILNNSYQKEKAENYSTSKCNCLTSHYTSVIGFLKIPSSALKVEFCNSCCHRFLRKLLCFKNRVLHFH